MTVRTVRLKTVADVVVSNVDKHSVEGEAAVKLCNYVDVYKNTYIDSNLQFMESTASDEQIRRYSLQTGDVIITKDSESPSDIAVPALVTERIPGLVCGYHLAVLRANRDKLNPRFLLRVLQSRTAASYFTTCANGITRYGLSYYSLKNAPVPVLKLSEQEQIADFLDRETAESDALDARYERLIELLEERRVALITQAVTKGLNPDGPMKDSGVEWLGDIPKSWNIMPFRYCGIISEGQVDPTDIAFRDLILIAPNHVKSGTGKLFYTETAAEQGAMSGKYRVRAGDVVYSKIRPALNKVTIAPSDCLCSADMYPIRASKKLDSKFLLYSMLAQPFANLTTEVSMRVAMPKINRETLASIPMAIPDITTQREIVAYVESTICEIDKTISETVRAVTLVREHRSALITAAVTGQIDVSTYRSKKQQMEVPA